MRHRGLIFSPHHPLSVTECKKKKSLENLCSNCLMKCHSTISADIETIICNGNKLRFIFDSAKECEKVKRIVKMDKPVTEEEKKEADSLGISLLYIVEVEVRD